MLIGNHTFASVDRVNTLEDRLDKRVNDLENRLNEQKKEADKPDLLPPSLSHFYSQDGEDMVLKAFYEDKPNYNGFYVDIGAYHPFRLSNTQWFYENGWSGINIDATPNSMKVFNEIRKRDINVEIGISDEAAELEYYIFEESVYNSFDKELSEKRIQENCKFNEVVRVKTSSINDILEKYLPKEKYIDFITMDVEGFENRIINSFDFDRYSPDFFLIEEPEYKFKDFMEYVESPMYKFLKEKSYIVIGKTKRTVIFKFIMPLTHINESWNSCIGVGWGEKVDDPLGNVNVSDGLERHVQRVSFEISNLCNYSNIHKLCPVSWYKVKKNIDPEIVYKVIDELIDLKYDGFIAFHRYNEPLLNKELLFKYIEYTNKMLPDAKIIILTNGYYLYQEDLNRLENCKIYRVGVSSYNRKEHERLIRLNTIIPYGVFYAKLDDRQSIYTREPKGLTLPCYATIRDITINCHGQVSICCLDWDNKEIFGDLHKNTLKEVLNSERFLQVHNELIKGERNLEICKRCDWQR
jgi:FkbM family methyltransferase